MANERPDGPEQPLAEAITDTAPVPTDAETDRRTRVARAAEVWAKELVDLSGRNNLLYYRDLKRGTMSLDEASPDALFRLLGGQKQSLRRLFSDVGRHEDAVRRARTIHAKSRANYEERGLRTAYLAVGIATWESAKSGATPAAPILLVPVDLKPKGASRDEFDLETGGELEINPTLLHCLYTEFGVRCDPADLAEVSGIEGAIDTSEELSLVYDWLREHARQVPGFDITERCVLGNFSYAKMPMVVDLESASAAMADHDIVAALAGDQGAQEQLRAKWSVGTVPSPDQVAPADEYLVLDADASQSFAINAVLAGRDVVIKGPPGTGKSQTISNLIASLVARGKSVLFVAEKRAAIDAVVKRLHAVGLGELVLDLHGGVTSRRQVARELGEALQWHRHAAAPAVDALHGTLEEQRRKLGARSDSVHNVRERWGVSYFDLQCRLLELKDAPMCSYRFGPRELEKIDGQTFVRSREALIEYVNLGGPRLSDSASPWRDAEVRTKERVEELSQAVISLKNDLGPLERDIVMAAEDTGARVPTSFDDAEKLIDLWRGIDDLVPHLVEGALEEDLAPIARAAEPLARSPLARFAAVLADPEFRSARRHIRAIAGDEPSSRRRYEICRDAAAVQAAWRNLAMPGQERRPRPCSDPVALAEGFSAFKKGFRELCEDIGAEGCPDDFDGARRYLGTLADDFPTLASLPRIYELAKDLDEIGLKPIRTDPLLRTSSSDDAACAFEGAWLRSIQDYLALSDREIGSFDGNAHNRLVAGYQRADKEHIDSTAVRVRRRCAEHARSAQDAAPQEASLIRHEAAKRTRHRPLRDLFEAAPNVLTAVKPCWAMSPLIVSQTLPSEKPHFDVVIFDEASQVRPAESIPAILRGKQLVVAGDEKQLPPTVFFASSNVEPDIEEEQVLAIDSSFESILEALLPFVRYRMLEWHYRSKDERLIAFSNANIYDKSLTTFPGAQSAESIRHELVPFDPERPADGGSTPAEVDRVADLVIEHAEASPDRSLGVIAMGIKHARRIEDAIRERVRGRRDLDAFFDENRAEPCFVKNLERVQGDERDVIILSIGYGKDRSGRLLYRFGPLAYEGGERRLNVAVTRAKERMVLVSSFSHLDMDPDRSTKPGVQLLRAYLEYCASGGRELGSAIRDAPKLNPFECDVGDRLRAAGLDVIPQYGVSGYRIDFAVKHPEQPGQMVLAVECDGASYHSSPAARDRDRLRQEQLERVGWRFHRIWSQDWFADPEAEVEKAVAAYWDAVEAADGPVGGRRNEESRGDVESGRGPGVGGKEASSGERSDARPAIGGGHPITTYSDQQLMELIRWIESDGFVRTETELLEEAIEELGYRRRGSRIVERLAKAIRRVREEDS